MIAELLEEVRVSLVDAFAGKSEEDKAATAAEQAKLDHWKRIYTGLSVGSGGGPGSLAG